MNNSRGLIVHEWLEPHGGAERVVDSLTSLLPGARLLTLWNDDPDRYRDRAVEETWIARTPLRGRKALSVPILPITWRTLRNTDVDWAIVSSHLFAHQVRLKNPFAQKLVYVHTPPRYIWDPGLDPRGDMLAARILAPGMRAIDRHRAMEITSLAANSGYVRERIRRVWHRESEVIYPPVDAELIASRDWIPCLSESEQSVFAALPRPYLFAASRLVAYKRIDRAIRAAHCGDLSIVIAGGGPERFQLEALAQALGVRATFLGHVSDTMMRALFTGAYAYVFPATEDFGIMPVEAMATGTPVIGSVTGGGVLETVVPGVSGALADFEDPDSVRSAIDAVSNLEPKTMVRHSLLFDRAVFKARVRDWCERNGISAEYAS